MANNYCRGCERFAQYYESGLYNYWTVGCGFCSIKNDIVNVKNTCEDYRKRPLTPLAVEEVVYAIDDVNQIKKLLKALKVI